MCRHLIGDYFKSSDSSAIPWGTFIANVVACFILGIILQYELKHGMKVSHKLLFATGFCGGFSTFSTFSAEIMVLFQRGQVGVGLSYVGISLLLGVLAIYIGYRVAHFL